MDNLDADKSKFAVSYQPQNGIPHIDTSVFERSIKDKRERDLEDLGFAHVMYERLVAQIKDFQDSIAADEEVATYLASFGTRVIVLINNVGFHNPYYITFDGLNAETGERVRLVQHTSQTSVLLVASKVKESRKPRRIGFDVHQEGDAHD